MADPAAYLIRSGAYLALFYAFYWLALRRETFFALNRAYLLAAAILALGLPLLRIPSPFSKTVIYAPPLPVFLDPAAAGAASPHGPGLLDILSVAYAAGAGLFLLLFLVRLGRLALLVGRCGCVRHHGLKVVLCGHPGESFSFFKFVFLNTSHIPEADVDRVLTHELAHVRQLHSFDIVLSELLTIVQWFNPFVWPYKSSLRETHEYLADRAVIAQGCSLARYQLLIVEQHVGGELLELASSFRTSQIKRRIMMLSKQETKGLARWKPLLALPLALVLALALAESRTIVKEGRVPAAIQSGQEGAAKTGAPAKQSEEEMVKAYQWKMQQIQEMKQKNAETLAKLQAKLEETTDAADREKLQAEMKDQKVLSLEIGAKERMLHVKKLEYELSKETDTAKKADLEKKIEQLKAEAADLAKKADTVRNATAGVEKQAVKK
jgi:hypothetical protein